MNCEDFLPSLETGGMLRRWRARRHAAGCRRCASVAAAWAAAKHDLAAVQPLSAGERRIWRQVAFETAPVAASGVSSARAQWFPLPAGVAAAACVLVCAVALVVWKLGREQPIAHPDIGIAMIELDPASEFVALAMSVQQLRAELDVALIDAERMEARQQATELLDRYSKW